MKKVITIVILICLLFSSSVVHAEEVGTENTDNSLMPLGDFFTLMDNISVYCKEWDKVYGASYKQDMTFDTNNCYIDESTNGSDDKFITYFCDGILAETDNNMQTYSLRIKVIDSELEKLPLLARICGIISVVAYDWPKKTRDYRQRFLSISQDYMDALDSRWENAYFFGSSEFWIISNKGVFSFFFVVDEEGDLYLSTRK